MRHTKPSTFDDQIGRRPANAIDRTGQTYCHWKVIDRDSMVADHWFCRDTNTGAMQSLSTQALRSCRQRAEQKRRREEAWR